MQTKAQVASGPPDSKMVAVHSEKLLRYFGGHLAASFYDRVIRVLLPVFQGAPTPVDCVRRYLIGVYVFAPRNSEMCERHNQAIFVVILQRLI